MDKIFAIWDTILQREPLSLMLFFRVRWRSRQRHSDIFKFSETEKHTYDATYSSHDCSTGSVSEPLLRSNNPKSESIWITTNSDLKSHELWTVSGTQAHELE